MKQTFCRKEPYALKFRKLVLLLLSVFVFSGIFAQERIVTGNVTDKSGQGLPGVNVIIKGTTTGTVTDLDGKYSIKAPSAESIIQFTYVGYVSQEVKVGDQTQVSITMSEDVTQLNEVVVIGYGVQKKSDLTGAVASVSGSKLQEIPVSNLAQALQGRAAGVSITSNTGMPGGSVNIQIRGMTSINGTNPLTVIDGIPGGDITKLNPADIESVEVLKDAASAAIYGSSGGNGVIIVTTKKGKSGKIQTNVNAVYGLQNVTNSIEMMDLRDYNALLAELKLPYTTNLDTLQDRNWEKKIFKSDAPMQSYDFSTAGGSERSNFYISGAYLNQKGIIEKTEYTKMNFRIKADQQITQRVKFDQNASFTNTNTEGFEEWMLTNVYHTPVYHALIMPPYLEPYDANGKWLATPGGVTNPMVRIDNRNYYSKNASIEGNAGLTFDLFKGFTYTSRVAGSMGIMDRQIFTPKYFAKADDQNTIAKLEKRLDRSFYWMFQNVATYNTSIAETHNLSVMAGTEASRFWGFDIRGTRQHFQSTVPNMLYFNKALDDTSNLQNVRGGGEEKRKVAYFGRLSYDYKSMILLQFNLRRDGDSDFGPNNRFGNFKSGSAGFKFTELDAVKDLGFLSFGKVRVSYGETGQFARSNWPYFAKILTPGTYIYNFDDRTPSIGAGPVQIPNPDIQWETVISQGIGLDLGFYRDQLTVSFDLFKKTNDGMLMFKDVTTIAGTYQTQPADEGGVARPEINMGKVENTGIEMSLTLKQNFGDLKAQFDLNLTYVKNKIVSLATDSIALGNVHNELSGVTISKVGHPIGEFWGMQSDGIIKEGDPQKLNKNKKLVYYTINSRGDTVEFAPSIVVGDARWIDFNNDGQISTTDRTYLGNPNPPLNYSFSLNLSYKSIDFSAFFNGVYGNKVLNGARRYLYGWDTRITNRSADFADRYRDPLVDANGNLILYDNGTPIDEGNTTSTMPRIGMQNWGKMSNLYLEDGSYFRLKTITLGYTLPNNVSSLLKIEKFRIYCSVTNVFTITKYSGFDPEVARYDFNEPSILGVDIGGYPKTRMITFGANLTF